jgi:hypothetical protein
MEDMSLATRRPGFADQRKISETALVVVEIMEDLVNGLDGYVNCVLMALGSGDFSFNMEC